MLDKLNQYSLAVELINRHARIAVIVNETKVPKKLIKKTYRELIGRSGSSGPIRNSSRGLIRNSARYKEATLFAVIFKVADQNNKVNNIYNVIEAFDFYKKTSPSGLLDFTTAWIVARDIKLKNLIIIKCPHCGSSVLLNLINETSIDRCCVCRSSMKNNVY